MELRARPRRAGPRRRRLTALPGLLVHAAARALDQLVQVRELRTAAPREAARRVDRGRRRARSDVPALWRQRQRRQARCEGWRQRGQGLGGEEGEWLSGG